MRRFAAGGFSPSTQPDTQLEDKIRPLAQRLAKQRPWRSAEENWLAAEKALRQRPWRPWIIRFSGEKERSGWDWTELSLKISVPILILFVTTFYSMLTDSREERIAREERESAVVTSFIQEMKSLILAGYILPVEDKPKEIRQKDGEARGKQKSAKETTEANKRDATKDKAMVLPTELMISALSQIGSRPSKWMNDKIWQWKTMIICRDYSIT